MDKGSIAIEGSHLDLEWVAITAGNQLDNVAILEGILWGGVKTKFLRLDQVHI